MNPAPNSTPVHDLRASPRDHYAIVVSRFNETITAQLLAGASETLQQRGVAEKNITVAWVPGAFELPIVCDCLAASGQYVAVIALGAVIQGETSHHEYINMATAHGLMQTGLRNGLPVLFGVLTCHSMEQAKDRAGGKAGNKGVEAALAAIETVNVLRQCGR
jgi:6,7-dimethyl-8-ribityllumazine synthase